MDYNIKDSGEHRNFPTGARRDKKEGKGRYDLLPFRTIHHLAIHFQKGAAKYEPNNWRRGIPTHEYVDSALRHISQFMIGSEDENHLISAIWNLCCLYETILMIQNKELEENLNTLYYKTKIPDIK